MKKFEAAEYPGAESVFLDNNKTHIILRAGKSQDIHLQGFSYLAGRTVLVSSQQVFQGVGKIILGGRR